MADSENSSTLSAVTRMGLLSGPKVRSTAQTLSLATDAAVLALWRESFTACGRIEQHCRMRKQAEARLIAAAHSPLVEVPQPGGKRPAAAFTAGRVDALRGMRAKAADARIKAPRAMDKRLGDARRRTAGVVAQGEGGKTQTHPLGPSRVVAGTAAKPDAVHITPASGQHRTNNRKSELTMTSRS